MQISEVNFVLGAASLKQVPCEGIPQLAFLGRSNAGKSSLMNALLGKNIVKTSGTPGKTREINFFLAKDSLGNSFYLVDLPGVGYAKVSKSMREDMANRIRNYVRNAKDLLGVIYLVDIRHGGHRIDFDTINGIVDAGICIIIIASKADKLNQGEFIVARKEIKKNFHLQKLPLATSAKTKKGIPELWEEINEILCF